MRGDFSGIAAQGGPLGVQHKKVATFQGATDCLPIGGAGVRRTVWQANRGTRQPKKCNFFVLHPRLYNVGGAAFFRQMLDGPRRSH
jgi:hypothetical protein